VKEDGTFVLSTYGTDDGAPAGDYAVTVQWYRDNPRTGREGLAPPISVLPFRYTKAETSGLRVRIRDGENEIPTLKLTR
jgi:hypothetical protein